MNEATRIMRFPAAVPRDPGIAAWIRQHPSDLAALAQRWFEAMRACGPDVRELMHDGCPTACIGDAAFAYVAAYRQHVNVGFFLGAQLEDPAGLLEGTGKFMRHVKLRPAREVDAEAIQRLVDAAYRNMQALQRA